MEPAGRSSPNSERLAEERSKTLSAVCGLRLALPLDFEMVEAGELEADKVTIVRASSSSSWSMASLRPSLPFQVL